MGPFQVREMYIYPLWLHMTYTCTTRYPAWPVCTTLSLFHKKRPLCWFYSLLNTLPPRGSFTCASVTCGLYFHLCSNIPLTPKPSFPTPQTQQPYFQPPLYVSFPSHLSEDHSLSCSTFVFVPFKVFSVFFFLPPQVCELRQSADFNFITILSQPIPQTVPAIQD